MRTKILAIFVIGLCSFNLFSQQLKVEGLLCEYQTNPLGMDVTTPRFSWKLISTQRGALQTTYELRVGMDSKNQKSIWQSGKISSGQSVHVPYAGPSLQSRKRYYWQVRVRDNHGNDSGWSEINSWEMGLLQPGDWSAQWIQADFQEEPSRPAHLLRKSFDLKKKVQTARLYVTSRGLYEATINGSRVGTGYLTPGWTSYNSRIQYQVYDITSLVTTGKNAIGVMLGNGWYRGFLAFQGNKNTYGDKISLLCQLEVVYSDGSMETIVSDDSWKSSTGPVRMSEIYNGEVYDARLEKKNWTKSEFDDVGWSGVKRADASKASLVATYGPMIRKHETFKPLRIFKTPKGENVVDFGQNLVGWVQLKVSGKAGDHVQIRHAEVLDKAGNFYTDNLRAAKAEIQYTLKGQGVEVYEPHFTFFGFRYISVTGYPGELKPGDFTAITLYSDMQATGSFECSNPMVNQLQHNIQWGQKGNFLDVPTDCPQRDERLGWTGDAQAFSRTAAYNMNVAAFFSKWLKDLAIDQNEDGAVPFVIPNVLGRNAVASAGWADAATIIPWNMYLAYGDKNILAQQYPSMKAWVGYMEGKSKNNLWNTGFHFGDWLFYRPSDDNDGRSAVTDKYLIAQAFYVHSTKLLISAAEVLGKTDDVTRYSELLEKIKTAFVREYVTPNGRMVSGTQTAYVLALNFDLLPTEWQAPTAEKLVQNIHSYNNHLTTGFLGTPYLCHVLSRFGYNDVAYTLLLRDTYPSWLYPVKMGATTIWERWDGIKPDSTFQTPGMNSYNHYAYGAIGDWMYRVITGINTDISGPGYKQITIAPRPGGGLTNAIAGLQTLYGTIKSAWKIENGRMMMDITIPANTSATVVLPHAAAQNVTEQKEDISRVKSIQSVTKDGDAIKLSVGSGSYHFEYDWEKR